MRFYSPFSNKQLTKQQQQKITSKNATIRTKHSNQVLAPSTDNTVDSQISNNPHSKVVQTSKKSTQSWQMTIQALKQQLIMKNHSPIKLRVQSDNYVEYTQESNNIITNNIEIISQADIINYDTSVTTLSSQTSDITNKNRPIQHCDDLLTTNFIVAPLAQNDNTNISIPNSRDNVNPYKSKLISNNIIQNIFQQPLQSRFTRISELKQKFLHRISSPAKTSTTISNHNTNCTHVLSCIRDTNNINSQNEQSISDQSQESNKIVIQINSHDSQTSTDIPINEHNILECDDLHETPETFSTKAKQYNQEKLIDIPENINSPIGNIMNTCHHDHCRIYFQNINGAKKNNDWRQWQSASNFLNDNKVSITGYAETNVKWNHKNIQGALSSSKHIFDKSAISTSSSSEISHQDYQPGGTATLITNDLTGHIQHKIQDHELGRWSGFQLLCKNKRKLYIITCYIPHVDTKYGTNTCYQQQWRILRNKNIEYPNARTQLYSDLAKQIQHWTADGSDVILMTDANEDIGKQDNQLTLFLSKTKLTSLTDISLSNNFSTYARGHKCIDFIFGTKGIADNVVHQGFLPFYEGAWLSDHRGLFIDINYNAVFGIIENNPKQDNRRGVSSKDRKSVERFLNYLHKDEEIQHLLTHITHLENQEVWSNFHSQELENIDKQFTKILINCDQKCIKKPKYLWSPELHQAILIEQYWTIQYKSYKNHIRASPKLNTLRNKINNDELLGISGPLSDKSSQYHLKLSKQRLDDIKRNDLQYREKYLLTKQEYYITHNKLNLASAVKQLMYSERSRRCFKACSRILRAQKTSGGLTHILIPVSDGTIKKIDDSVQMEVELIKKYKVHFAQADGTPFTTDQLVQLYGKNGCTTQAQELLEHGFIPTDVPPTVAKILQQLRRVRDPLSSHFSFEDMIYGLRSWRESTTTSPSSKHLGIYKALIISLELGIYSTKEKSELSQTTFNINNATTIQYTEFSKQQKSTIAYKCLSIQHKLLTLAIKHCHTFDRWKVVHNFFLEKIPGSPLIHKLRAIHLYEADWNLILKYFIANKLIKSSYINNTMCEEQAGGRPGKSADATATKTVIALETCRLQKLTGGVMYNDAMSCYDRIVENLSNICCMREGLHPQIAQLHHNTMNQMKYFIKHKNGVSQIFNSSTSSNPIYGTGQGSGDSGARWGFISDALIRAYNKYSNEVCITGPISISKINEKILAFVDDTRLLIITPLNKEHLLLDQIQHDTQLWEQLLFSTGGQLELGKCKFTLFEWSYDQNGTAVLKHKSTKEDDLQIIHSESKEKINIEQINHNDSYKILGIHIAADGNSKDQEKHLLEKVQKFEAAFSLLNLQHRDIELAYKCIITPSLRYALPATSIPDDNLNKIQKRLINIILPKLGYNRHFPRTVAYASECFGGLGLHNLAIEQGIEHVNMLIAQIRAQTTLGTLFFTLLESYQIAAGMIDSPLIDTTNRTYIQAPWLDTTRRLLYTSNAKIILQQLKVLRTIRNNDSALMNDAQNFQFNNNELILINNCRLYLQVTTLAEICNDSGTDLLPEALYGYVDCINKPKLWNISRSLLNWPIQSNPPRIAWNKWQQFLSKYVKPGSSTILRDSLGPWNHQCHNYRQWKFQLYENNIYYNKEYSNRYTIMNATTGGSRSTIKYCFTQDNTIILSTITRVLPLTPRSIHNDHILVSSTRCTRSQNYMTYDQPIPTWDHFILQKSIYQTNFPTNKIIQAHTIYLSYEVYTKYITSYGWSISDENEVLLVGNNYIPPTTSDSELRKHSYSTLCSLYAYRNYLLSHQCPLPPSNIILQIKSKTLFSILHNKRHYKHITPSKCMEPEYEIINAIIQFMKPNYKYKLQLSIDKTTIKNTSEICLQQALTQHKEAYKATNISDHSISYQTATLIINDKEVTAFPKQELRNAMTSQELRVYYNKKYNWNNSISDTIDWELHSKALKNLKGSIRSSTLKFIHEWLPLNGHAGTGKQIQDQVCPHCMKHKETADHFLICKSIQPQQLWELELLNLEKFMNKSTDTILMKLLLYALEHWLNKKEPDYPTFIPHQYKKLFYLQKAIGWDQIAKGRFSFEWVRLHDQYMTSNNNKPNGTQYFQQLIHKIWRIINLLWKERCNSQHNKEISKQNSYMFLHYKTRVVKLYDRGNDIEVCDRQLFDRPIEEVLQLPIFQLKRWLERNEQFVKEAAQRSRNRSKLNMHGIKKYFAPVRPITVILNAVATKIIHPRNIRPLKHIRFKNTTSGKSKFFGHSNQIQTLLTSHLPAVTLKHPPLPPNSSLPRVKLRQKFNIPGNISNVQFRPP